MILAHEQKQSMIIKAGTAVKDGCKCYVNKRPTTMRLAK